MEQNNYKILFINSPSAVNKGISHLPLIVAYPATILKKADHEVEIIDLAVENINDEELFQRIHSFSPNLIVINSETTVIQVRNFSNAIALAQKINKNFPEKYIAMTGAHATFKDKETLERNKEVSFVVRYEPDYILLNLTETLRQGRDLKNVAGITYRQKDTIIRNLDDDPIMNLDSLPFPDRSLFPISEYLKRDHETTIQGSRGCLNHCYFCQSSAMDRVLRLRSTSSLVEEVKEVLKMGFESIFFSDLDFGVDIKRMEDFCDEIIKQNIKMNWICNIRADKINDTEQGRRLLSKMKESGCYRLFMGFESISPQILNNIHKEITPQQLLETATLLKEYGINLHASFLFGLPGDTEETIRSTVEFAKYINPQMISFNVLTPFPGTKLGDEPEKFGVQVVDKFWYEKQEYNNQLVAGSKNLSPNKLRELVHWAYEEFFTNS
jgi:radical SAM superfamily enzyme YgiQ (UPF0313 family)